MEMDGGSKAYGVVILIQVMYAGMHIISKLALDFGLSPFVFVFYRQAAAVMVLLPFAFIVMRRGAPPLSFMILFKMFMHALIGITLSLNVYNVALNYTSATVASATNNSIPVITFFLAVLLSITHSSVLMFGSGSLGAYFIQSLKIGPICGMESLKLKSISGIAKMVGMTFCIAGIMTIAFYTGPSLKNFVNHHHDHHVTHEPTHSTGSWIKGSFLMIFSNTSWSLWLVLQGKLLKEYPSKLLFTTFQCIFSMIQTFLVSLVFERNFARWKLHLDMGLLAVTYSGFLITGLSFYFQSWCIEKKGPVFLAMSTPLAFVFTIIGSSFILGKTLSLGSVLGGVLMVGGLYSVLWGKNMENRMLEEPCIEKGKACNEEKEMASSCPKIEIN